jgi:ComF family protein
VSDGAAPLVSRVFRRAGRGLLDLLLPPLCLTCDRPVAAPGQFCATCFQSVTFITAPFCVRCGAPFVYAALAGGDGLCAHCRHQPPAFSRARAAFRYDAMARRLILPFKHGDRTDLAQPLARFMARAGKMLLEDADLLVPVPLHRTRLLSRRYNQAALLAGALARLAGRKMLPDALRRVRATPMLGDLSAAERAETMAGVIAVRPGRAGRIAGRRILLIDDVLTTGATTNACARALLAAGARDVDVLALARVPATWAPSRAL